MEQPELDFTTDSRLEAAFRAFDRENPEVWSLFCRFTGDARKAGLSHYSADAVLHRIRWFTSVETKSDDGFRLNNNFAAYYARKWQRLNPEAKDFFRTRVVQGERAA